MATEKLILDEITSNQSDKFLTHNEALRQIEGQLTAAVSRTNGGPPVSPSAGNVYIVDSATGDWSSAAVNDIAHYYGGAWNFYSPVEGVQKLWVADENVEVTYDGSAWINSAATSVGVAGMSDGSIPYVASGVLTEDATNLRWDSATNTMELGGDLEFTAGAQSYTFTTDVFANHLTLQNQNAATAFNFDFFAKDGDGSDDTKVSIYGLGTPGNVTNSEQMLYGYDAGNTRFELEVTSAGTGTDREFTLITGGADTLTLDASNNVSIPNGGLIVENTIYTDLLKHSPREIAAILTASDAAISDEFGTSCALSSDGSVLAVGAFFWDATNLGAVYIYDWNGTNWVERTTALTASDAEGTDRFGISCALSNDGSILAVGAYKWDGGASDQGAIYIYDWNGTNWVERTTALTASDAGISDEFGISCALSSDGSILAVGAYLWDGGAGNQGAVYIYDWNGTNWVERTTALTASDAEISDLFGISCALSSDGSVLAVGAISWDGGTGNQGAVYIYDWNGTNWVERTTALTASDAGADDRFGRSCALSSDGSILAVGADKWDGGASDQGAVYIYDWDGTNWVERTTALTASDAGTNDRFGISCALSNDGSILAVGASKWDGGAGGDQGAIYSYALDRQSPGYNRMTSGAGWLDDGNSLVAKIGATNAIEIDASQNVSVPNGRLDADNGISFDSGSNVLDTYEEGTWTPVIADASTGGNTATFTTNTNSYVRVGNVVTAHLTVSDIDTTGMTAGNVIFIRGLPYAAGERAVASVILDNFTFSGFVTGYLPNTTTYLNLTENVSGSADADLTVASVNSGVSDLFLTVTYEV